MTLNARGKGLSDSAGPPGLGAFSWISESSGFEDCETAEPGRGVLRPNAGWGRVLGGRRTVAGGVVGVVGLLLIVGAGRVADVGGVVTREGCTPGRPG
jgi:hypothetical protein